MGLRDVWRALSLIGKAQGGQPSSAWVMPAIRSLPPRRGTREFLAAYSQSPWLRAVVSKISEGVGATEWQVTRKKRNGQFTPIENHPLTAFMDRGNEMMTGLQVRKITQTYLDIIGEAFWLLERDGAGRPYSALPLAPYWVIDIARPARPFYVLNIPNGFHGEIKSSEIIHFREIDPLTPYERGTGVTMALADEFDADEQAAKFVSAFLANRARPDIIITGTAENPFSREDAARMEAGWVNKHQGPNRAGRPSFMPGEVNVHELGYNMREVQMVELREFERDIIVSVFGVPPEKLGILTSSNKASIAAADLFFAKDVIFPRLASMREMLQQRLVPQFGDGIFVEFDSPVDEDNEFKLRVMTARPEAYTVDDWRALSGDDPLPDNQGKVFVVSAKVRVTADLLSPETETAEPDDGPDGDGADMTSIEEDDAPKVIEGPPPPAGGNQPSAGDGGQPEA